MLDRGRHVIQQTIASGQTMRAHLSLKIFDASFVRAEILGRGQMLEPDRIELQPPQTQHPLQRHREISPSLAILRRETASNKDRHAVI